MSDQYFTNAITQIRQATEELKESNDLAEAKALQNAREAFERTIFPNRDGYDFRRDGNGYNDWIINAMWEGFLLGRGYSADEIRALVMEGEADQLKREAVEQTEVAGYKDRDPQND